MQTVRLSSSGKTLFPLNVEGESKFDQNIRNIIGFKNQVDGVDIDGLVAQLIPENPLDPTNCIVNVFIKSLQVGWLNYQDGLVYRKRIAELGHSSEIGECEAKVRGGFKRDDGTRANFGVNLDLDIKTMTIVGGNFENFLSSDDQLPKMITTTIVIIILVFLAVTLCAVYSALSHSLGW